ncbi:MAG: amidase [Sedimentitalea sp.]
MTQLLMRSALQMAQMLKTGDISAVELLQLHFDQIDRLNPQINAVIWQDRAAAMVQAQACDAEHARGHSRGPLHGVPITVKESFDLAGSPTTWGIPEWAENVRSTDSDVVKRYRAAGGIVFGKTNVPLKLVEWQSFNAIYGSTSNPWDISRTPGGSSGGAAAALACGMSALEAGSDIGSSIRNPAHYCGVFGLKPTWNAVSMQGHLPEGWYGDIDIGVGGPLARSAADLMLATRVLAGPSRFEGSQYAIGLPQDPRKKVGDFKVAVMLSDAACPVDQGYQTSLARFADTLEKCGATVVYDQLPNIDSESHFSLYLQLLGAALSFGLSDEDAAQQIAQFDDLPADVRRVGGMRYSGMGLSHRAWLDLDNQRRIARLEFDRFFEQFDVILAPVCASAAFPKDEIGPRFTRRIEVNDVQQLEIQQLFWSGYSGVVGLPSVVGPMDNLSGLPVGYQAITGHGRDYTALAFARAVEAEIIGFTPPPLV